MANTSEFAVKNLILALREVQEMDLANPAKQIAALEMLTCALDLIDDGDPPVRACVADADVPHIRT